MKVYLIHHPNGDIYHRTDENIMDDIHDMMEAGECSIECWRNDVHLESHSSPSWGLTSNADINDWLETQQLTKSLSS
jgi:hypothetical protein